MPTNHDDTNAFMTAPLTRRDLEEVLDQRLANYATKDDLERFATKDDLERFATKEELERFATKDDLEKMRKQIAEDGLANVRMVIEENRAWFRAIDDQYKDLPERVHKLEVAVFSPPPRARRRKSG